MIVMKFGGTSVADCAAISRTIEIIRKRLPERPVVVVSALSKVTDLLYRISDEAKKRDFEEASTLLGQLRSRLTGFFLPVRNTECVRSFMRTSLRFQAAYRWA